MTQKKEKISRKLSNSHQNYGRWIQCGTRWRENLDFVVKCPFYPIYANFGVAQCRWSLTLHGSRCLIASNCGLTQRLSLCRISPARRHRGKRRWVNKRPRTTGTADRRVSVSGPNRQRALNSQVRVVPRSLMTSRFILERLWKKLFQRRKMHTTLFIMENKHTKSALYVVVCLYQNMTWDSSSWRHVCPEVIHSLWAMTMRLHHVDKETNYFMKPELFRLKLHKHTSMRHCRLIRRIFCMNKAKLIYLDDIYTYIRVIPVWQVQNTEPRCGTMSSFKKILFLLFFLSELTLWPRRWQSSSLPPIFILSQIFSVVHNSSILYCWGTFCPPCPTVSLPSVLFCPRWKQVRFGWVMYSQIYNNHGGAGGPLSQQVLVVHEFGVLARFPEAVETEVKVHLNHLFALIRKRDSQSLRLSENNTSTC